MNKYVKVRSHLRFAARGLPPRFSAEITSSLFLMTLHTSLRRPQTAAVFQNRRGGDFGIARWSEILRFTARFWHVTVLRV